LPRNKKEKTLYLQFKYDYQCLILLRSPLDLGNLRKIRHSRKHQTSEDNIFLSNHPPTTFDNEKYNSQQSANGTVNVSAVFKKSVSGLASSFSSVGTLMQ
jgi:hypothetical protein